MMSNLLCSSGLVTVGNVAHLKRICTSRAADEQGIFVDAQKINRHECADSDARRVPSYVAYQAAKMVWYLSA